MWNLTYDTLVTSSKIEFLVLGSKGLVGSAVIEVLSKYGRSFVGVKRSDLDLNNINGLRDCLDSIRPEIVILAAAKVGGIMANKKNPVDFLQENLKMQSNVFEACNEYEINRLVFLGSSCIYPKNAQQPIKEEYIMTGELESTNKAYAMAKLTGISQVQSYRQQYQRKWISVMPTNLFGKHDNFNLETSHVLPALMRKMHEAKIRNTSQVTFWGSGTPKREFMHANSFAEALLFVIDNYDDDMPLNIGVGKDISIKELANQIKDIVNYKGEIAWDMSKPDGTSRKLLDVSRLKSLGWEHQGNFRDELETTYLWFQSNYPNLRL
jgi:GDP-L-fucose synthase